jgi:CRP/FNR family transcriptional regulator, cyclic AMP receptor protein
MIAFENCTLFSHLPAEALARLAAHAQTRHFAAGEVVFKKGDPGDGLYVVESGEVEISDAGEDAVRQILARVLPGEVFGEMAVLDGQPRSAFAAARTEAVVGWMPSEELLCLLEEYPELALKFLRQISGRLREFNRQCRDKAA